ncbi:MAG: nucleotide exchange factor GrpE [Candidatus Altiarchaeota archaeon]
MGKEEHHRKTPKTGGKRATEDFKADADEYKGLLQRVQADFENYKKRVERDKEDSRRYANQEIVEEFLEVKDNLERALDNKDNGDGVIDGVRLTLKQLEALLKKHGVEELNPSGDKFDPNYHEALMAEEGDVDGETVSEVLQKGYMLHSRVVRPAKVKIIKPRKG